ncbi:MAG: adenylate/guanylate cyclase domain-containing protein [Rhodospirillales bacterium]|nr:adenylate/guanylate cyclase domain-containing protein [Rhodospirillales bacterium]
MAASEASESRRGEIAAIALGTALFVWLAGALSPALRLAENWLADLARVALAPAPPLSSDLVLVTITEDTLAALPYRSPVNRRLLAEAVEAIARAGAKGLALDILFDQPTEAEADARLSSALRRAAARMPVVTAYARQADHLSPAQIAFLDAYTKGLTQGLVNLPTDPDDGAVRWALKGMSVEGRGVLPGFALALARSASPSPPALAAGTMPLAYPVDPAKLPAYPLQAIPLLPAAWLAGKYILIGADLPHSDRHRTPFAALLSHPAAILPGVTIHAMAFNQELSGLRLGEAPPWALAPFSALMALLAALALGHKARLGRRLLFGVVVLVGYGGAALLAIRLGYLVPILPPLLAALIGGGIQGGREWRREQKKRAFVQEAFARYLSPAVVKLLVQDPTRLRLGGEQREITYVFTDIAGFTTVSEKLAPELMATILNGYLDRMCQIALAHEATIDKIVGDAVVAFFNAPLDQPDHARRAVRLAVAYDAFSEDFRAEWRAKGIEIGITRVGVNTGRATVGNFGGQRFFNYTGHGDSVNTAARLESVNKHLGTRICISGTTAAGCPDQPFRPVATLVLKGKSQGLEAVEPMTGQPGYAPLDAYQAAFGRMAAGDPTAGPAFAQLAQHYPGDPLVSLHAKRLAAGESGARIVLQEK